MLHLYQKFIVFNGTVLKHSRVALCFLLGLPSYTYNTVKFTEGENMPLKHWAKEMTLDREEGLVLARSALVLHQ